MDSESNVGSRSDMGCVKSVVSCCLSRSNCCRRTSDASSEETSRVTNDEPVKTYSWDNRPKNSNYKIEHETNQEIIREPGSINGQQIVIANCKSCQIYLLDHSAAMNIDDCEDCVIICGPVKGSIFLRDTINTTLCSASAQLRLRDTRNIHLFVGSESEPIIEASQDIHIGAYPLYYTGIEEHFNSALLSRTKLVTNSIYDFTPPESSEIRNWTLISPTLDRNRFLPHPVIASRLEFSTTMGGC